MEFEGRALERFDFAKKMRLLRIGRARSFLVLHGVLKTSTPFGPVDFVRIVHQPGNASANSLVSRSLERAGVAAIQMRNGWVAGWTHL